ncbi:MAG: glycosyltransferase family A protein [Pseudomonadota bacterium]
MSRPKRGIVNGVKWWWRTRIAAWWTVWMPARLNEAQHASEGIAFQRRGAPLPDGDSDDDGVTAILTVYKRGHYLQAQVDALRAQSCPPREIWVWCNDNDDLARDASHIADRVLLSNSNWKFWGRFSLATMVRTRWVCLLDDDILPEPEWLANCLATWRGGFPGILGGSGVILPREARYSSKHKVGWNGHHYDEPTEVDLVGHAWFFHRDHLQYLWREAPVSWENGEDIHFSAMALKHGGVHTYVPPHPESDPTRWSCRPEFGKIAGRTRTATHNTEGHGSTRDEVVRSLREGGWQVLAERDT